MASLTTIETLKKLSTFGAGVAAENAYNEYKTQQDTERFEANLKSMLPEVMKATNTNPAKMANAYSVNNSSIILSNLDTTTRDVTATAKTFAGLDPAAYNRKLAEDLLPSLQSINSLQGAEKTVAMKRFQDQVQVAQATHMKANKQYIQTQTRNVTSSNINTTIDNVLKDPRKLSPQERVSKFDGDLTDLLVVARNKGLPDLDAQKLISDVFLGKISQGDLQAENLLMNSKFRSFVNPESLRVARAQGEAKFRARHVASKASGLLTKKQQQVIFDERLNKAIEEGKDLPAFIASDTKYIMGISNNLFNQLLLSKANEITLTNDPTKDEAIIDNRNQIAQTIAVFRAKGIHPQALKNKLNDQTAHLGPVIDAIYSGVADEWADYDKRATVGIRERVQPGTESRLNNNLGLVRSHMAERIKDFGDDSWFGPIGESVIDTIRGLGAPFSDKLMYTRSINKAGRPEERISKGDYDNRLIADMGRYETLKGRVDWSNPDDVSDFVDYTYRFDALGGTTVFTRKGEDTFSGTMDRQETDTRIKELGDAFRTQFISKYSPDNPGRYENLLGNNLDMITYEVNPMNNRMKIYFNRFDNVIDRTVDSLTPQRVDGLWRIDVDENGDYQFELLDKKKYEYAMKSPVFRAQLEQEGWRHTSLDGAVEIDPTQFRYFAAGQLEREGRLRRRREEAGVSFTPIGITTADTQAVEELTGEVPSAI